MSNPRPTKDDMPHNCNKCKESLLGNPIPKEYKMYYAGNYFKKEIGIEIPEKYDGVWYYECPHCKAQWGGRRAINEELGRALKARRKSL